MNKRKFGSFLKEANRLVPINDEEDYLCGGVKWNGCGVFIRETKAGFEIKKKHVQHTACENDIIYCTLFAQKGAFAVVEKQHEQLVFSEKFPTFQLTDPEVSLDYLRCIFKTDFLSRGSVDQVTGMAAISLAHLSKRKFLAFEVPMPSYEIQQQIAKKCMLFEKLSKKADSVSSKIKNDSTSLKERFLDNLLEDLPPVPIGELGAYVNRAVTLDNVSDYTQVTVGMNHTGARVRCIKNGSLIKSKNQFLVKGGDLIYSKIDLRNGAIAFVPETLSGAIVTSDFPLFEFHEEYLDISYLTLALQSSHFMTQVQDACEGTTNRRRIKKTTFPSLTIPWPDEDTRKAISLEYNQFLLEHRKLMLKSDRLLQELEDIRKGFVYGSIFEQ